MSKTIKSIAAVAATVGLLGAGAIATPAVAATKIITIATEGTYAPFSYVENGKLVAYRIDLAVAGFTRDEIKVSVQKKDEVYLLTVKGSKNETFSQDSLNKTADGWEVDKSSIAYRDFERQFTLGLSLNVDRVSMADGILSIHASVKERPSSEIKTFDIS
jgi:HSP20 family molecular chaperone IbpA